MLSVDIALVTLHLGYYSRTVALDLLIVLCEVFLFSLLQSKSQTKMEHSMTEVRWNGPSFPSASRSHPPQVQEQLLANEMDTYPPGAESDTEDAHNA